MQGIDKLIADTAAFFSYADEALGIAHEAAAEHGLEELKRTTRYNNDTGATRRSSLVYVPERQPEAADEAAAAGDELNPGTAIIEEIDGSGDLHIIFTAFQDYDDPLEARVDFIGAAADATRGEIAQIISDTLREALG